MGGGAVADPTRGVGGINHGVSGALLYPATVAILIPGPLRSTLPVAFFPSVFLFPARSASISFVDSFYFSSPPSAGDGSLLSGAVRRRS